MREHIAHIASRPVAFVGSFLGIFFVSAVMLYLVDFVPEAPKGSVLAAASSTPEVAGVPEAPTHVRIASIGVDTPVTSPTLNTGEVLDEALLSGAVHYPGSALLNQTGTVYLFGHQSYLPIVRNHAFKAFNDVQKLKPGDTITVSSSSADYTYTVRSVVLVKAANATIALAATGRTLILSTCNSLSSDEGDRYVVTADFISRTTHA